MTLKTTVEQMKKLLHEISHDLEKAVKGNKAASQRVRTNSIQFSKTAKIYRKESIHEERKERKSSLKGEEQKKVVRKKAGKKATRKK